MTDEVANRNRKPFRVSGSGVLAKIDQASRLAQIGRVEPLVEPPVDLREEITRTAGVAVGALQAGQADRGAQLERVRLLTPCDRDRPLEAGFRSVYSRGIL